MSCRPSIAYSVPVRLCVSPLGRFLLSSDKSLQHRRRDVLEFAFHRLGQARLMSFPEFLDRMRDHAVDKLGACWHCLAIYLS